MLQRRDEVAATKSCSPPANPIPYAFMRLIGHLDHEADARRFGAYLFVKGITSQVEPESDGRWAVWVYSEDDLQRAHEEFARFGKDPTDPVYQEAFREAGALRPEADEPPTRTNYIDARLRLGISQHYQPGLISLSLIAGCIAVAVWSNVGNNHEVLSRLFVNSVKVAGDQVEWEEGLPDIRRGEVWRLFTPIFIHFGLMHLVFNLFWLNDLGSMIERRRGMATLAALVLVCAPLSNLAQYAASGPLAGGMSGVVYCLFGYVWLRGRFDPDSGLHSSRQTVIIMLAWFGLCLTGLLGPIGNAAHASGLTLGMAWGFLSSGRLRRRP